MKQAKATDSSTNIHNNKANFRHYQWRILLLTLFGYLFYYAGRLNFSFAIIGLQNTFSLTTVHMGMIGAAMLTAYGLGQAVNGVLGDIFSARKLFTIGALLTCLLNWCTSFAVGFWTLIIPWAINGYAQSFGFAPSTKIVTNWWDESECGLTFGLLLFTSSISSVVAFGLCIMTANYLPWPWLFRIPVTFTLISALIFYVYTRDTPKEYGFHQNIRTPLANKDKCINKSTLLNILLAIKRLPFISACFAMGFASIARYGLLFWIPLYFMNLSKSHGWLSLALPVGMAFGSLASGLFSDRLFKHNQGLSAALMMLIATILVFILFKLPNNQSLWGLILLFLAGFFIYGPQTPLFAMCPKYLGINYTATGVGIMNACAYGFSAIGELIIGYAIQYTHKTAIIFFVVSIACLISAIFALLINPLSTKAQTPSLNPA